MIRPIESLERRTLLAAFPHDITVHIFRDLNRDGIRDAADPGMAEWVVRAATPNDVAGGSSAARPTTDSAGDAHFVSNADSDNASHVQFSIGTSDRYWFTTTAHP